MFSKTERLSPEVGKYNNITNLSENGQNITEKNHVPPKSVSPLSEGPSPVIRMKTKDHRRLLSTGSSRFSNEFRARQAQAIKDSGYSLEGYQKACEMEYKDIIARYDTKYKTAIEGHKKWVQNNRSHIEEMLQKPEYKEKIQNVIQDRPKDKGIRKMNQDQLRQDKDKQWKENRQKEKQSKKSKAENLTKPNHQSKTKPNLYSQKAKDNPKKIEPQNNTKSQIKNTFSKKNNKSAKPAVKPNVSNKKLPSVQKGISR